LFGASALLTPVLTSSVADPSRMPPFLVGRYLAPFVGEEGVTHLLALARSVREIDLDDVDLTQVHAQTLIVRGEKDGWVSAGVAQRLASEVPGGRVITMADAARLVPEDAPNELADLIASFVSPRVGDGGEEILESIAESGTTEGEMA
jgi:pimeloyl-ACP methyl ester carboxylesterase